MKDSDSSLGRYVLAIKHWSATDYAHLINNDLGWVSDDQKWYCFNTKQEMLAMKAYLDAWDEV